VTRLCDCVLFQLTTERGQRAREGAVIAEGRVATPTQQAERVGEVVLLSPAHKFYPVHSSPFSIHMFLAPSSNMVHLQTL
jgi:hypothetical protein